MRNRKVIAMVPFDGWSHGEAEAPTTQGFAAVCDDGTFFMYELGEREWRRYPGIPGTEAEEQRQREEAESQAAYKVQLEEGLAKWQARQKRERAAKTERPRVSGRKAGAVR